MGRVWARGRVLGDLHRHNDLDIFQHSRGSVCSQEVLLLAPLLVVAACSCDMHLYWARCRSMLSYHQGRKFGRRDL
jgi:hypothetical protein